MTPRTKRLAAGVLALSGAYVGVWALLAPHSFFDSFPGFGRHWVAGLPPYNEHLVRDVGGLYLALTVVTIAAAVRARPDGLAGIGLGWLVFNVAHLGFHVTHLSTYDTIDRIGNVLALGVVLALSLVLLVPARARDGH